MQSQHKAFPLDYDRFHGELAPILQRTLDSGDLGPLSAFVEAHRDRLRDPDIWTPLAEDWRAAEAEADAQRLGDLALTAYYDPTEDVGLSVDWEEVAIVVAHEVDPDIDALIAGEQFGPAGNPFDPGTLGSYFRPWDTVRRQRERVAEVMAGPAWSDTLKVFDAMLRAADERRAGLYITF